MSDPVRQVRGRKATFDADRAIESEADIDAQLDRCPCLVLDDYGAEQRTDWSERVLYALINRRYNSALPTIVTTNIALEVGDRTVERLADVVSTVTVKFAGESHRLGGVA